MKKINETTEKVYGNYPEKILQFGEGNFLRAFADWMIDNANESGDYQGSIVLCQPIASGLSERINEQDGIYTLVMRGIEEGKPVEKIKKITSVSRCINPYNDYHTLMEIARSENLEVVISNTTEAGIVYQEGEKITDQPPSSFPAKICAILQERYFTFSGDMEKGLLFLPVELIDHNGDELKRIVLKIAKEWGLSNDFLRWIEEANHFANTLVDRIVTGYPKDEITSFEEKLEYQDSILVTSELFHLWVIEGKEEWAKKFPIHKSGNQILWTEDVSPYKLRKVRILNGGHTATVLAAYLAGHNTVLDFMKDPLWKKYLETLLFHEVIPTLDLPKEELVGFASAVTQRFANPYIKHNLLDISLNSCSKFLARCLPTLISFYEKMEVLPKQLTFSFAALIQFYQCEKTEQGYFGKRADGTLYPVRDEEWVLSFFSKVWKQANIGILTQEILSNKKLWGEKDLTKIEGLKEAIQGHLESLQTITMEEKIRGLLDE